MKKVSKILTILMIACILISYAGVVNAASVSMTLNSSSKLKAGDTIEVTLKIGNITAGDGIDAIVASLDYDKNVFEQVTQSNFVGLNQWNVNIYDATTQIFTMTKSAKVNTPTDVLKITLKVKNPVNVNSTTITIKDISASGGAVDVGGTGDITVQNTSIIIQKETTTTVVPEKPSTNLPKTGEEVGIIASIAVVSVIAVIAYVKYRNIQVK